MKKNQSFGQRVIRGSLITIVLTILGSVFAYLIRILYSRSLTIEDYGLFYAVLGLIGIITTYSDLGFGYAISYLVPKYIKTKKYSKAWHVYIYGQTISLTVVSIASIFLVIFAQFLAKNYFKVEGSENVIYIFCIYLITSNILNGLIQLFSGMQKEVYYSSITVSRWALTFAFSLFFLLFNNPNILLYTLSWALGHVATASIFAFLLIKKHPYLTNNKLGWEKDTFTKMRVFALPAFTESIMGFFVVMSNTFILTLFKGVKDVGIYNIIYPITSISTILFSPLNTLLLPLVSHLMEGEKDKISNLINKILQIAPFFGVYFSLFIIMFPSPTIKLIFGEKWVGLVEIPLIILAIGSVIIPLSNILGAIVLGTGKVVERLKLVTGISVVNMILNVTLISQYGVLGAVITTTIISVLSLVSFFYILKSVITIRFPFEFYLKILVASVLIYFSKSIFKIEPQNIFEFILTGAVYSLIFAAIGYYLKMIDIDLIKQIFRKS